MSDDLDADALRAAQPSVDAIARDQARAAIGRQLFDAPGSPYRLDRFVILDRLGRGGMGVVYSAYDPVLDRRVALKLLRPRPGRDRERMRARMQREAQALARLSHPNVVSVYDVGTLGDEIFIVMEFVVGQTLRAWAFERPWHEVLSAYLQAARGLAAAHAVGLVHRDVKPENIMVGDDGRVRVLDFGLVRDLGHDAGARPGRDGAAAEPLAAGATAGAKALGELDTLLPEPGSAEATAAPDLDAGAGRAQPIDHVPVVLRAREQISATNAFMGTPEYMAPEQAMGTNVGPQSDQFSFCLALYEALYGKRPFAMDHVAAFVAEARAARALVPDEDAGARHPAPDEPAASSAPPAIWPILRRGLSADPAQRWPSMDAIIEGLSRLLADHEQTIDDARAQGFQRRASVVIGFIMVAMLAGAIHASVQGLAADMFTPRTSLFLTAGMTIMSAAFLAYARRRWQGATYLRRLLQLLLVSHGGMLVNSIIGLWLGRSLYQTVLANLVMLGAVQAVGSMLFARWMAWLVGFTAAALILCLLIPEYHLVFFNSAGIVIVSFILMAWNRHMRQRGATAPATRSSVERGPR